VVTVLSDEALERFVDGYGIPIRLQCGDDAAPHLAGWIDRRDVARVGVHLAVAGFLRGLAVEYERAHRDGAGA
jgi:hypothetical protein